MIRILIVDDEVPVRKMLRNMLKMKQMKLLKQITV